MTEIDKNIHAYVDLISAEKIEGWIASKINKQKRFEVLVYLRDVCLARGISNIDRKDLISLKLGESNFAFSLKFKSPIKENDFYDLKVYTILLGDSDEDPREIPISNLTRKRFVDLNLHQPKSYQSFEGEHGDSLSGEKLRRLRLPDLKGRSFLDIGCNEGFFCKHAVKVGAKRVLGIDSNKAIIEMARLRTPEAEFICASWWDLPDEKFDYILFSSAIHYEKKQLELLEYICNHLNDNGKLILECGISGDNEHWTTIQRHDGILRYPSFNYLTKYLLRSYATTEMGRSVDQKGDPVPRYVFHCARKKSVALLISGKSGSGKTVLTNLFKMHMVCTYRLDGLFYRLIMSENPPKNRIGIFVRENGDVMQLDVLSRKIISSGLVSEFVSLIHEELPLEADLFVVEGEAMEHSEIASSLIELLNKSGVISWRLTNGLLEQGGTTLGK
jgi:SAM-dependent methyltransferase